jgi:hypothetical protein
MYPYFLATPEAFSVSPAREVKTEKFPAQKASPRLSIPNMCRKSGIRFMAAVNLVCAIEPCWHLNVYFWRIDAHVIKGRQGLTYEDAFILRVTMAGYEYLDSVRDPEV